MTDMEYINAKSIAFKYVVYKRRTINEVRNKLKTLDYDEKIIEKIIEELICFEYLNDEIYIQKFVEKNTKDSINLLKIKLSNKGIEKELIDNYFYNNISNEIDKIIKILIKRKYNDSLDDKEKDRIKAYCARRGFKINDIEKAIKQYNSDEV